MAARQYRVRRKQEKENVVEGAKGDVNKKRAADSNHNEEPPSQRPKVETEVIDSDDEDFDKTVSKFSKY